MRSAGAAREACEEAKVRDGPASGKRLVLGGERGHSRALRRYDEHSRDDAGEEK